MGAISSIRQLVLATGKKRKETNEDVEFTHRENEVEIEGFEVATEGDFSDFEDFRMSEMNSRGPLKQQEFRRHDHPDGSQDFEEEINLVGSNSASFTKMEVLRARTIDYLTKIFVSFLSTSFVSCNFLLILSMTIWAWEYESYERLKIADKLTFLFQPHWLQWMSLGISLIMLIVTLLVAADYFVQLRRTRRMNILPQQQWFLLLLFSTIFFLIPVEFVFFLDRANSNGTQIPSYGKYEVVIALQRSFMSICTLFFPWCMLHSYRLMNPNTWKFYRWKVLIFLLYGTFQQVSIHCFHVFVSEVPFTTFIYMIRMFRFLPSEKSMIAAAVISLGFELLILSLIVITALKTNRVLRETNYMKYRSRQVAFVLFKWISARFLIVYIVSSAMAAICIPIGFPTEIAALGGGSYPGLFNKATGIFLKVMIFAWTVVAAFLNLPNSVRLKPQLRQNAGKQSYDATDPITYTSSNPSLLDKPNCFVMDVHVQALNLAWLAYYAGTQKIFKFQNEVAKFSTFDYVFEPSTDTVVLIAKTTSQCFVAFRGTSTFTNMRIDAKISWKAASTVFNDLNNVKEKNAVHAKIHSGFVAAYHSVAERLRAAVKDLTSTIQSPLIITGHSLGGALATLFALDLAVSKSDTAKHFVVSTFGCPKVGNSNFRKLYESKVGSHWRVELGPDLVTRLPPWPYEHVGKQALLTEGSDLLLDPSHLDISIQKQTRPVMRYHRKASYLAAMIKWCKKQHGAQYKPAFLPFPLKKDEKSLLPEGDEDSEVSDTHDFLQATTSEQETKWSDRNLRRRPVPKDVLLRWRDLARRVALELENTV